MLTCVLKLVKYLEKHHQMYKIASWLHNGIPAHGVVLVGFLAWDTPRSCLECDGIRYGKQFKLKVPPELPHEPGCRCEATKLFYTSDDVFQGTSPILTHKSALGDISAKDALLLKNILLKIINDPEADSFTVFMSQFESSSFSADIRSPAIILLEQAFKAERNE